MLKRVAGLLNLFYEAFFSSAEGQACISSTSSSYHYINVAIKMSSVQVEF